jgi:hypothetical protein
MDRRAKQLLWLMIVAGLVGRVVLGFKTYGVPYDTDSAKAVRFALSDDPFHVYSAVNGAPFNRWPYPPGFLPWIMASGKLEDLTGLAFHGWIQLPQIAADGAIAWLVQDHLGSRGAGQRTRLIAVALVMLGPAFWIISGYHGQVDSLAILPAVLALWLWERWPPGVRRGLAAGLLIGLGAAIKFVPVLMIVALLPWVRSRREAAALIVPAVAVPVLAFVPFLVTDGHAVVDALRAHRFLPGFGGISLLAQPELASNWLQHGAHQPSSLTRFLLDHEGPALALLLLPFVVVVLVRRPPPTIAAALLWPAFVVVNLGFEFHFVVWALPFLLMAGLIREVALLEAALFIPAAELFWHPFGHAPTAPYVVLMIATWIVAAVAVVLAAVRMARAGPRPAPATA